VGISAPGVIAPGTPGLRGHGFCGIGQGWRSMDRPPIVRPRASEEVGPKRRSSESWFEGGESGRGSLGANEQPLVKDEEPAVEELPQFHPAPGIASFPRAWRDVDESFLEMDGVVVGDRALIATGENGVELSGRATPCGVAFPGEDGEADVVVGHEFGQVGDGSWERVNLPEPQLDDQSILQRLPEALDAPLGLRAEGGNVVDAELLEGAAQVGGFLASLELFFDGPVLVVSFEDARAVPVDPLRQSVRRECVTQDEPVAMEILMRAEDEAKDRSGGIVEGSYQIDSVSIVLKPREGGAIDQDHGSETRLSFPSAAVLPWPAAAFGSYTEGTPHATHGFPAHAQPFEFTQLLGNMAVVYSDVRPLNPVGNSFPNPRRDSPSRRATPIAVAKTGRSQKPNPFLQPSELAETQPRTLGTFSIGDPTPQRVFHRAQTPGIPNCHEDSVHRGDRITVELARDRITVEPQRRAFCLTLSTTRC
jgi:hypothetical protein